MQTLSRFLSKTQPGDFSAVFLCLCYEDICEERESRLCRPTFIYNVLSLLFMLKAADIIDVPVSQTGADWRWRSIPLHLARTVSTCIRPEADAGTGCLEPRWERLALLIRPCSAASETRLIALTRVQLHGRASTPEILYWTSVTLEPLSRIALSQRRFRVYQQKNALENIHFHSLANKNETVRQPRKHGLLSQLFK